jgi:hypothetical protein
MKPLFSVLPVLLTALALAACRQTAPAPAATPAPAPVTAPAAEEAFTPGLGEIMTLQQMRHTKLWLAGEAANWDLADYEIKELGEGFDDVVKFHPTHEDAPVAPKDAIPRMVTGPVSDLQAAIMKKDKKAFEAGYDALTKACNDCHSAMNFGFNVVQRPTSNPYPNQVFTPQRRSGVPVP